MRKVVIVLALVIFSTAGCAFAGELSKKDVVAMVKKGVSENEVVWQLEKTRSEFSLTDEDRKLLDSQGVSPWIVIVMEMTPQHRSDYLPLYYGPTLSKEDIAAISKKGIPAHEICLLIPGTMSKYNLSQQDKEWLKNQGVHPLVISVMDTQKPSLDFDRGGKPVQGGRYYDNAVTIVPGTYHIDRGLRPNEFSYFKINVKNGQKLFCTVRTTDLSNYGGVAIHFPQRTLAEAARVGGNNQSKTCAVELYDSRDNEYYILFGLPDQPTDDRVIYDIKLADHFDAGTKLDAPKTFENALLIKPGKYIANWAPLDDVDLYKTTLKKGQSLTVKVTPSGAEKQFKVSLLNADRETMNSGVNKESGSVAKASMTNNDGTQEVFIRVDRNGNGDYNGKYELSVDVQ